MHGPRAVRLDASLRAAHRGGGLGDIEFLPVTQEKRLALTRRQRAPPRPRSAARSEPGKPSRRRSPTASDPPSASSVSRMSKSPSPPAPSNSEKFRTTALRTFWRRNQSIVAFDRMRWNSSGSSAAGRSAYFSASRIIVSWTMSSAASSSRTAYTARFQARFSTLLRKSESSLSVAKEGAASGRSSRRRDYLIAHFARRRRRAAAASADAIIRRLHDSFRSPARPTARRLRAIGSGTAPASRGRGKVHRWFFVREIHRGEESWKRQRRD